MTVRQAWERVRESLFFVPALLILASMALAWVTTSLDRLDLEGLPLLPAGVVGARAILSTIAGATITVAAIVFSITAVAVQLASTQYSPRVLGGIFRDRIQQWVIGVVVGTFTFSLSALALGPGSAEPGGVAPRVTVSVAVALAVISMLLIVVFIDHTTRSLTVTETIRRISDRADRAAQRVETPPSSAGSSDADEVEAPDGSVDLPASASGWVRQVRAGELAGRLSKGTTVRLADRVGAYISQGDVIATVWPEEALDDGLERAIHRAVVLGRFRDPDTDVAFAIRQLVDIALRALSPGINDPTTAIDVLQHLRRPVRTVLFQPSPRRVFTGGNGGKIVMPETRSRSDLVWGAFAEIRLAARGQPEVIRVLLEVLADLTDRLEDEDLSERANPLREQARLAVQEAIDHGYADSDLERILRTARRFDDETIVPSR